MPNQFYDVMNCPNCGEPNLETQKICPKCGFDSTERNFKKKCISCGEYIPQISQVCPECGFNFLHRGKLDEIINEIEKLNDLFRSNLITEDQTKNEVLKIVFEELKNFRSFSFMESKVILSEFKKLSNNGIIDSEIYNNISAFILRKLEKIKSGPTKKIKTSLPFSRANHQGFEDDITVSRLESLVEENKQKHEIYKGAGLQDEANQYLNLAKEYENKITEKREEEEKEVSREIFLDASALEIKPIKTKWFSFWTYFSLPVGSIFSFFFYLLGYNELKLVIPETFIIFWIFLSLLGIITVYGLHKKRAWAWSLNWLCIFSNYFACIQYMVLLNIYEYQKNLMVLLFAFLFGTVFYLLIWFWPNYVYWNKRRILFD